MAASVAIAGAVSVLGLCGAGIATAVAAGRLGSEFLFDQPQPTLETFLVIGDTVAIMAVAALVSLTFIWRAPGWSLWRRMNQTAFTFALAAFSAFLLRWGLAFGGPI